MTYHTPELLLVGAAHNLVLGTPDPSFDQPNCVADNPVPTYSDLRSEW